MFEITKDGVKVEASDKKIKLDFDDTFFSLENIIELVTVMAISGWAYYNARKNKKKIKASFFYL